MYCTASKNWLKLSLMECSHDASKFNRGIGLLCLLSQRAYRIRLWAVGGSSCQPFLRLRNPPLLSGSVCPFPTSYMSFGSHQILPPPSIEYTTSQLVPFMMCSSISPGGGGTRHGRRHEWESTVIGDHSGIHTLCQRHDGQCFTCVTPLISTCLPFCSCPIVPLSWH